MDKTEVYEPGPGKPIHNFEAAEKWAKEEMGDHWHSKRRLRFSEHRIDKRTGVPQGAAISPILSLLALEVGIFSNLG